MYHYLHPKVDSFGLFNKKKKPFSIAGQEPIQQMGGDASLAESLYTRPGFQIGGAPSGGQHQGFPDMTKSSGKKGLDYEGMMEALLEHESEKPAGWASMGKPGGTGGGGFKLFPNSMVDNRTPIGPFDEDEQRKRWWAMYGNTA